MEDKRLGSAIKLLDELNSKGYEAYLVGGFVRDHLLNMESKDIDITTNATSKVLQEIFPDSFNVNKKFNTLTVRKDGFEFEVTTYRKDKKYKDHRHPVTKVATTLKQDVKRRDFTINALCMNKDLKVIDLVSGMNDLKLHLIRAVGKARKRFNEDALRMFRAFRFASRLGFKIDEKTYLGIKKNHQLTKYISVERIRTELEETVSAPYFKNVLPMMIESEIFKNLPELEKAFTYLNENYQSTNLLDVVCLASYLKDDLCEELKLSKKEKNFVLDTLEFIRILEDRELTPIDMFNKDYKALKEAIKILNIVMINNYSYEDIDDIYKEMPIHDFKDLNINGDEIIANLDITDQTLVKRYLLRLSHDVLYSLVENDNAKLISYLKGIKL
ncbi:MAG: CCA tRNA nucleotidyltransferase [Gammaproteobacteria bacterium]|nr:CCA tRNA nucleotidyltransferase [Gammaproteobacteria bacterium]